MTQTLISATQTTGKVKSFDLKYDKNGKAILKINIETKRFDGKTTFFNAVCFGKLAENIANNINQNDIIYFTGTTMTSSFKNKQNHNVYTTQILIASKDFKVLEKGEPSENEPLNTPTSQIDISDDDLPF